MSYRYGWLPDQFAEALDSLIKDWSRTDQTDGHDSVPADAMYEVLIRAAERLASPDASDDEITRRVRKAYNRVFPE